MRSMGHARSLWLLGFLALSVIAFTCSRYNNMILVHGQQHDYHIPQRYDASGNVMIYGVNSSNIVGADTPGYEAYLRLSHKQVAIPELGDKWELTWLLFWDKDYSGRFRTATKAILEDAKRMGLVAGFHHYHEITGGGDISNDYYVSFDPESSPGKWEIGDYYVKKDKMEPFKLVDRIVIPKAGCELNTIHDGIAIDVTVHDDLCEIDQFPLLYQSVVKLMESWKIKDAQR